MKLYMEITTDEYELPLIVADSVKELALKCDRTPNTIHKYFNHVKNGKIKRPRFIKVEVSDYG